MLHLLRQMPVLLGECPAIIHHADMRSLATPAPFVSPTPNSGRVVCPTRHALHELWHELRHTLTLTLALT